MRSRSWLLLLGGAVVLAVIGIALWLTVGAGGDADGSADMLRQGVAQVRVTLKAEMPPDFDDGIPEREIAGEGLADFERNLASVEYAVDDVPNSAGFFGHVDGDLSVVYEGSRFLATFPLMADVLEGELDWMSYQLSDFSHPTVLDKGIGQLREIGLSDPRLGFALISSTPEATTDPAPQVSVDLAQAAGAVDPDLRPTLEELQDLGVQRLIFATTEDTEGVLTSYSYELTYPPDGTGGGAEAEVSVTVEITDTGVQEAIEVPPETSIQSYREYLGI